MCLRISFCFGFVTAFDSIRFVRPRRTHSSQTDYFSSSDYTRLAIYLLPFHGKNSQVRESFLGHLKTEHERLYPGNEQASACASVWANAWASVRVRVYVPVHAPVYTLMVACVYARVYALIYA